MRTRSFDFWRRGGSDYRHMHQDTATPLTAPSATSGKQASDAPGLSGEWFGELSNVDATALENETLRLHERYQREVVEEFNLCPWARPARLGTKTLALCDGGQTIFERIDAAATSDVEVAFVLLPTYSGRARALDEFVARLIATDARRHREQSPPFAMAAFHPATTSSSLDALCAEALVTYLRRSPNPTIQLVRLDALARVRQGEPSGTAFIDPSQIDFNAWPLKAQPERPSLRQRVARANHAVFRGPRGRELVRSVEAILEDRRSTFARLGMPTAPWETRSVGSRPNAS